MATTLPTYTGELTSLVASSGIPLLDSLLAGSRWGTGGAGNAASVTFSFPTSVGAFDTQPGLAGNYNAADPLGLDFGSKLAGFSPFSQPQQEAARQVLQAFANVANLNFSEVPAATVDAGVLRFANSAPPGLTANTWGVSWFPQDLAGSGDTWMNSAFLFPEGWAPGTQNFLTLLHEVGHALGLKHPHDRGLSGALTGWPDNTAVLPVTEGTTLATESTQTMVMAYNDIPGRGSLGDLALQSDYAPTTPMRWDIAALQYLYGANTAYNAGDTVYTFDGGARYNQTIWDGGGIDTIVATGSRGVEIDLRAGQWSKLGQPMSFSTRNPDNSLNAAQPQFDDPYTVFIYDTVTIENAIGGAGNDTIIGNAANSLLRGNAGNDTIDGGSGADAAVWGGSARQFTLAFAGAGVVVGDTTGAEGTDTLVNVERLHFADKTVIVERGTPTQSYANLPVGLYHFFIVAFDAAPGVTYMDQLAEAYRFFQPQLGDGALRTIVEIFTTKTQFTDVYATGLENRALATELVSRIVKQSASDAAKAEAVNDIEGALGLGWTRGQVIFTVFGNLANKPFDDPTWGGTAQQFDRQIAVAKAYSEVLLQSTTDLPTLRSVLAPVTPSTDVSSEAKLVALIGQALLDGAGV
jgi:Ca2+-binding RTX toxin-like protein